MKSSIYLGWQYVRYYKWQTLLLILSLFITLTLPTALRILIDHYQKDLASRANSTPLIFGVSGHRFDLTMNSLYFSTNIEQYCNIGDMESIQQTGLAKTYPIFARHTCNNITVVGVSADYFQFRSLLVETGSLPLLLGDAVLGANAAKILNKKPGDNIISDQVNLYSLAAQYPLMMNVVGVLNPTNTADDDVIFTDLKTSWIMEGLAHGHDDLSKDKANIIASEEGNITGGANVTTYVEITDNNIASFHIHAQPEKLPLTSIIIAPLNKKDETILKARYSLSTDRQILVPYSIIDDLMTMVFKIEFFVHTSLLMVITATALLLGLIVMLSIRLRSKEFNTLYAIGCSRRSIAGMIISEWLIIFAVSSIITITSLMVMIETIPNISYLL